MSEIIDRLNNAIMRGPIETPAWVCNTMRDAIAHIALLEKVREAVKAVLLRYDIESDELDDALRAAEYLEEPAP